MTIWPCPPGISSVYRHDAGVIQGCPGYSTAYQNRKAADGDIYHI
jgi:hypothetical protein